MATPTPQTATGPTIQRGQSSGDIWTPQVFIDAVEKRFGKLDWDLAATKVNAKAEYYITEADDALSIRWYLGNSRGGFREVDSKRLADLDDHPLLWLNPPYSNIAPWAKKCAEQSLKGAQILLLVPASVGANWYWDHVEPYADVYSVGRMVFDNCFDKNGDLVITPYPKDLILAHYCVGLPHVKMQRWCWKESK